MPRRRRPLFREGGELDLEAVRQFLQMGRYSEAERALDAVPQPSRPEWLRLKGWARLHLGDERGLEMVRKAARMVREGAGWYWQDLGALLFRLGRWQEAEEALLKALDLFTAEEDHLGRAWALHGLGVAHLHQGSLGWALRRGEEALAVVRAKALGRFRSRVLVLLSAVHRARGELREALYRARQAVEGKLDPDDRVVALRALGTALRLAGRPAQGRERLEEALKLAGEGIRRGAVLAELSACYLALGWRREAQRTAGEALDLLDTHAPGRARVLVVLAEMARREGKPEGVRGLLEEALSLGPYPLMEEALAFPQLFALAEEQGLSLPRSRRAPERPKVKLDPEGRRMWVGRREVPLEGSGRAFDLLVLLAQEGPLPWQEAAFRLWEEVGEDIRKRLHTTASRARDLVADREAVVWRGEVLELDGRRRWAIVG
ncbi:MULTISPECIES: tetratricopeptide repeat protein [Thermus]|uniref:tetratricopeptide repeat protein n=1 Tax=Thermus thalpophilus TaxID=2908147 RepID=UPI00311AA202